MVSVLFYLLPFHLLASLNVTAVVSGSMSLALLYL